MNCPICLEDVSIVKYLHHRRSCREQQAEREYALMREIAVERLQQSSVRYTGEFQELRPVK
jgi:hypothetical protein